LADCLEFKWVDIFDRHPPLGIDQSLERGQCGGIVEVVLFGGGLSSTTASCSPVSSTIADGLGSALFGTGVSHLGDRRDSETLARL
jgi:hypothetical protein